MFEVKTSLFGATESVEVGICSNNALKKFFDVAEKLSFLIL